MSNYEEFLSKLEKISKKSNKIKKNLLEIELCKVDIQDLNDNITELSSKLNYTKKRDLKLKYIGCNTEIQAIQDELLEQLTIRVQRIYRKIKLRDDLLKLDIIREYKQYLEILKEKLYDINMELLLHSPDLDNIKNSLLERQINYSKKLIQEKNTFLKSKEYENINICKSIFKIENLLSKIKTSLSYKEKMKIIPRINLLNNYPNKESFLNNFIN